MRLRSFAYATRRFGNLLPYIGIALVTVAFVLVAALGRLDLSLQGLYIAIPIIVASVWLIRRKDVGQSTAEEDTPLVALSSLRFIQLTLLNAVIFVASIILLLISEIRPLGYFVLMAAVVGIILVQIVGTTGYSGRRKGVILGELIVLALTLVWSTTLKYPLYIGGTDIPVVLYQVESVLQASELTSTPEYYRYFPLYRVLLASGVEVLGAGLRDGFFILAALAYVPAILFAYLIFKAVTGNERLSLIACFLFSVSGEFIYYGGYMVARALAFVFFIMILYLLFRQPRSRVTIAILGLFTVTLILAHQTTLIYVSVILALLVVFLWLLARPHQGSQIRFPLVYLVILTTTLMLYWSIGARGFVQWVLPRLDIALITHVPSLGEIAPGADGVAAAVTQTKAIIRESIASMIFLFFAFLGFAQLLQKAADKKYVTSAAIGLVGLICLIFYVPNVIHYLPVFTHVFLIDRIPLLLTVFMSLVMAHGVAFLYRSLAAGKTGPFRRAAAPVVMVLVVAFAFSSIASVRNASDVPALRTTHYGERRYFTSAELGAFSFVKEQRPSGTTLYSDYLVERYFFVHQPVRIIRQPDISYVGQGWLLLRTGELSERWLLFSDRSFGFGRLVYEYTLDAIDPTDSIFGYLASHSKMYGNGTTQVYILSGK